MTKIFFSSRAYLDILAETYSHLESETGGVLLGRCVGDNWFVLEVIDPGYGDIHRSAGLFEYDRVYTTHLANVRSRLYPDGLELLGLWHRHPGSFDRFSSTDDETHRRYTAQRPQGIISVLVNLDPNFRMTAYRVNPPAVHQRLDPRAIRAGDTHIPPALLRLKEPDEIVVPRGGRARPERTSRRPEPDPRSRGQSLRDWVAGAVSELFRELIPRPAPQPAPRPAPQATDEEDRVLGMVEAEMDDYLDHQSAYRYEVEMDGGTAVLEMEYLGQFPQYPPRVGCRFFLRNGTPFCRIGDRSAPYRRGMVREAIEEYIALYMQEHGEERSRPQAPPPTDDDAMARECVDVLELSVPYGSAQLHAAYRARLKEYHPDSWEHEGDPRLTQAATEQTHRIREAYQYLKARLPHEESA